MTAPANVTDVLTWRQVHTARASFWFCKQGRIDCAVTIKRGDGWEVIVDAAPRVGFPCWVRHHAASLAKAKAWVKRAARDGFRYDCDRGWHLPT